MRVSQSACTFQSQSCTRTWMPFCAPPPSYDWPENTLQMTWIQVLRKLEPIFALQVKTALQLANCKGARQNPRFIVFLQNACLWRALVSDFMCIFKCLLIFLWCCSMTAPAYPNKQAEPEPDQANTNIKLGQELKRWDSCVPHFLCVCLCVVDELWPATINTEASVGRAKAADWSPAILSTGNFKREI